MVAVIHCALNAGLVQGNQGKLNCYKEAGAKNQGKAGKEKNPFHLAHHSKSGRRAVAIMPAARGFAPAEAGRVPRTHGPAAPPAVERRRVMGM